MPHRHRYIRFFISSTLADMTRERNLLQGVLNELSAEYAKRGWTVEYVDLRWGITEEAGLDNRTIGICLDELDLCRELSPKPNFIILSGQRRGWMPLPESVPEYILPSLPGFADPSWRALFDRWYRLDTDCAAAIGNTYILQPRRDRFTDNDTWEREVYRHLHSGFGALPSATELEIESGALQVSDSREHVICYFRNLCLIPAGKQRVYADIDQKPIEEFRSKIRKSVGESHIIWRDITFAEYCTEVFERNFCDDMRSHIVRVINAVIDSHIDPSGENERHMEIAEERAGVMIGREDNVTEIDHYMRDKNASYALWFRDTSGVGKTTLMAETALRYRHTHNVIFRTCGESDESCNGERMLDSIWKQMSAVYPLKGWTITDLPGHRTSNNYFDRFFTATEMFRTRLKIFDKPLLIIVDSMDSLESKDSEEFFTLGWADCDLGPKVKIILTSTNDERINTAVGKIRKAALGPLSKETAEKVVRQILADNGRNPGLIMRLAIKQAMERCDRRPVYLNLLGHFLSGFHSYDCLPEIPADFSGLLRLVIASATDKSNHNPAIVRMALTLLYCSRYGLSHSEMLRALNADEDLYPLIKATSIHAIEGRTIPPILWSRLYHGLRFLFRTRHTPYGELIRYSHNAIRVEIGKMFISETGMNTVLTTGQAFADLAIMHSRLETAHDLQEFVNCAYNAGVNFFNHGDSESVWYESVVKTLKEPHFLHRKLQLDWDDLMHDINLGIEALDALGSGEACSLRKLKIDLSFIETSSWEEFLLQCQALHPESMLRKLTLREPAAVLKKLYDNIQPYNLIVTATRRAGENPILSNDGLKIVSLTDYRHRVQTEDTHGMTSFNYSLNQAAIAFDASADLNIHAIALQDGVLIYDLLKRKSIEWEISVGNPQWVSISADGKRYAYGNESNFSDNRNGRQDFGARAGRLSDSGVYLWLATPGQPCRINLDTGENRSFPVSKDYDPSAKIVKIIAASNDCCIMQTGSHAYYIYTYDLNDTAKCSIEKYYGGTEAYKLEAACICGNEMISTDNLNGHTLRLNVAGNRLGCHEATTLFGIKAISRNGRYAFSNIENRIYNLPELLDSFILYEQYNAGINTVASDPSGRIVAMTCGKNDLQDHFPEIVVITDGRLRKINMIGRTDNYYSTCAVSPDGRSIWTSGNWLNSSLLKLDLQGNVLAEIPEAGSKISLQFTADGRYLIALQGSMIVGSDAVFHIIDTRDNSVQAKFEIEELSGYTADRTTGWMRISADGMYAIVGPEGDKEAVDLTAQKILPRNKADVIIRANPPKKSLFKVVGPRIDYIGRRAMRSAYLPGLCNSVENDRGLVAVTQSGRIAFFERP